MAGVSVSLLVVFLVSGCQSKATASAALSNTIADRLEFDAGVIFADESNYLCIPFERLKLVPSTQIVSIETSCECVRGSVVSYVTPNQTTAYAVRLDFVPEPHSNQSEFVSMLLSVRVTLEIESIGGKKEFTVELNHSTRHAESVVRQ